MKKSLIIIWSVAFQAAAAVTVVAPEYQNNWIDRAVLELWREQLVSAQIQADDSWTIPLSEVAQTLRSQVTESTVIETPPHHFQTAIDLGWIPIARLNRPGAFTLFSMVPRTQIPEVIGTPNKYTTIYQTAVTSFTSRIVAYDHHIGCLRAMASGVIPACATTQHIGAAYAKRFSLDLVKIGEGIVLAPTLMFASPVVSEDELNILRKTPVEFEEFGVTYIPFKDARDRSLYADYLVN